MARKFPENLLLGFSSSAYQIEGGWDEYGKGENIWDRFTHLHPERIKDKSNGDIACDSFNKFSEDVQLIKEAGAQIYRFSLSWSRILPKGVSNEINQNGINYYNSLIDELIKNKIEPMVTLYHWDLPQPLQDLGGWPNPALADYFCDYAEVAYKHFGDRVKKWITLNEPEVHCVLSYGIGAFAPGVAQPGVADYMAGHTMLKAHAKAYRLYDQNFRSEQKGIFVHLNEYYKGKCFKEQQQPRNFTTPATSSSKYLNKDFNMLLGEVGISLSMVWKEPKTRSQRNIEAANESIQFNVGWFAHPIFSEKGDYPEEMKKIIAEESKREGLPRSRLPQLDQYWISYIKDTSDFFGLNHYTSTLVSHKSSLNPPEDYLIIKPPTKDTKAVTSASPDWVRLNEWFCIVPWGFRKCLCYIKDNYRNPKIYVTENGCMDKGTLEDKQRIRFHQDYLTEMLKAVDEGCRVGMYTAWTLLDNFEWSSGYTEKFGIYHVDFTEPGRKRTPKKSVKYFREVYKNRALPKDLSEYNC